MHSFLSPTPFFKAAAKVVESKRARTTVSQDKPNGNEVEVETEANLEVQKRFVNPFTYFFF